MREEENAAARLVVPTWEAKSDGSPFRHHVEQNREEGERKEDSRAS